MGLASALAAQQAGAPPPAQAPPPQGYGYAQQQQPQQGYAYQQPPQGYAPAPAAAAAEAAVAAKLASIVSANELHRFYSPARVAEVAARLDARVDFRALAARWRMPVELALDLSALALYDVVVFADDSGSMESDGGERIADLKLILGKVAEVATLFDDDGIALRFINSNAQGDGLRDAAAAAALLDRLEYRWDTKIAANMEAKVLRPFTYDVAMAKPLLVITITDGEPSDNPRDAIVGTILAARRRLEPRYGPGAVAFAFAQVGKDRDAQAFLAALDAHPVVGGMIDCTSYFELEAAEYAAKGVVLSPEMWLVKLMLGAVDPSYDEQDEAPAAAGQHHAAPAGGAPGWPPQRHAAAGGAQGWPHHAAAPPGGGYYAAAAQGQKKKKGFLKSLSARRSDAAAATRGCSAAAAGAAAATAERVHTMRARLSHSRGRDGAAGRPAPARRARQQRGARRTVLLRAASREPPPRDDALAALGQRAAAGAAAAVVGLSALLAPPALGHEAHAPERLGAAPGTAASRFHCTPLTSQQRADYFDLRGFTHPIRTSSPLAQRLFDQGLLLAWDFNHPEALRAFRAGLEADPHAPMLHFGVALSLGPYANVVWGAAPPDGSFPVVTPSELAAAQAAAAAGGAEARAAAAAAPGDPRAAAEAAYLAAAERLWGSVASSDDPAFTPALARYAEDLEAIAAAAQPGGDADAWALAAEARMNTSPWEHWAGPLGRRRPLHPDSVELPALRDIAAALAARPGHPLAAHLLIHLTEGGTPGSARDVPALPGFAAAGEPGADALAGPPVGPGGDRTSPAWPGMGHLIHMPSHTFLRVGRWHDAVVSNSLALAADEAQAGVCVAPYMPGHNAALLQFAAGMSGELDAARALARRMVDFPETFGPDNMSDGRERATLPLLLARFARWDELAAAAVPDAFDYTRDGVMLPPGADTFNDGVLHYSRALVAAARAARAPDGAGAARDALERELAAEARALAAAVAATPPDPVTRPGPGLGIYSPGFNALGRIELQVVRARQAVLRRDWGGAAAALRAAVAVDDGLGYTEPPRQTQPLRQCLGWVLLQAGRLGEAEQAYRADLAELPRNPWSLRGLQQVYSRQGPASAAKLQQVTADLAEAWAHADEGLPLNTSCPALSD
ncbi:hypothetical protein HT031_005516 [Scenedesmus sp. PABB004]|nr:hypothetical protein HT031_005516 [Scenedesmus sp. PABB004]